jgi:hypothetical protein
MFSKAKDILSLDECESVIDRSTEGVKEKRRGGKGKEKE